MEDQELHNLLFSAIQHHNVSLLDDLLEGENGKRFLDLPGEDGNMLLHAAVIENDLSCVECLLKHGANPNVFDTIRARTPLHLAVELSETEIVKAFLELELINLDIRDDRNLTCHEIAQFCDNQYLADIIKIRKDEIKQFKYDFYTVMNQACTSNQPNLVKELLEKYESRILEKLPRGWLASKDGKSISRASIKELINWSSSTWNDVTLLFKAASRGNTDICKILIEFGATAKCNDTTNYSPLYVAAYGGFTETVTLLLDTFPSLVREVTIEKWTILHACCLQGHAETAKLILTWSYPEEIKSRYVSRSGLYEYHFAFDLNAQDAAGQTVIYLAVSANDEKLLDTLLQFNVEAKLLDRPKEGNQKVENEPPKVSQERNSYKHARIIPDRPKAIIEPDSELRAKVHVNSQIDKIIRQLHKIDSSKFDQDNPEASSDVHRYLICPFEMDTYCDYNSKTALHLAVCQQYHSIATTLLVNGSNPNLPILSRDSIKSDFTSSIMDSGLNWLRSSKSTCLKEACRLNDELMCAILIRYGASDNQDNLALQVAASNKNNTLISKFLSLKSNIDPEYKINMKCNVEFAARYKQSQRLSKASHGNTTTTFSSMFPSVPVMIDWQNLKCFREFDLRWLIDASLIHNKRLKHPTTSLLAITRLDLSSNNLKSIHPVIFRLPSLRELNLSKNRLESLLDYKQRGSMKDDTIPTTKLIESHKIAVRRSKSSNLSSINLETSNIIDLNEPQDWDLPYLEILDLHDNRLISLPDCLFDLPKLSELDVSSNQIRQLPWSMWTAPSLKEVIASGNLLDDLPKLPAQLNSSISPVVLDESDLQIDERISITSNQSQSAEKNHSSFVSSLESDHSKEQSQTQNLDSPDLTTVQLESLELPVTHLNHWKRKIDIISAVPKSSDNDEIDESRGLSKITYLNLSHNSFQTIPAVLACLAPDLVRLNLSHNRLTYLGDITSYPARLKNLDMSYNQISLWFKSRKTEDVNQCFACSLDRNSLVSKFSHFQCGSFCIHRQHSQLEGLKSMNLSYNMLPTIQLEVLSSQTQDNQRGVKTSSGERKQDLLTYPSVTALDLSHNRIQHVPPSICKLKDLSVLNLRGNVQISSLPAELGLASKLWNLGINGCNLGDPLKSIIESKTYKTMDVIGYLRSILEEAKPYARMKLMLVGLQGIGKTSLLEQMRLEGSSGTRRRAPEHWTKRMGHTTRSNIRNQKGVTLSTVGVDIHDWTFCKRTPRNQPNFGPVSFSTWDFGGQQEFYATHRYFLSRRSMYIVVWRLIDGVDGILGIQQWLVNIQSRAPSSPVIIVGTHEDMVEGGERGEKVQQLQTEIHKRFINISDHDKCGLPRVLDSIVVSTKTKLNIKNLCNRIYDVVFSLRCPGSTERLLEQKIPATYLYLEEIVNWIALDRLQKKREPVLKYAEYKTIASEQLKLKYNKVFRDLEPENSKEINHNSELHQATRFLHENGVLLHYEDANLRDLYFLDPQWLCDILSHVVTIREINPHIKNGLMKIDDLSFLFKSIDVHVTEGIQSYVVNLLNKFEVALTWNSQYLLIPSLLPSRPEEINEQQDFQVRVAARARGRSAIRRHDLTKPTLRSTSIEPTRAKESSANNSFKIVHQPDRSINRLTFLRYLPAGFLARLQSGILSDPTFDDVCADVSATFAQSVMGDTKLSSSMGSRAGWTCWKSGISLALQNESTINSKSSSNPEVAPLLTIQEICTTDKNANLIKEQFKVEAALINSSTQAEEEGDIEITRNWCDFDIAPYSNIILITVSDWRLRITNSDGSLNFIEHDRQNIAKLLACAADHIDNLLEDWYPSLGTRFAHTLGGSYLVTRVIPCNSCFAASISNSAGNQRVSRHDSRSSRQLASSKVNFSISSATQSSSPYQGTSSNPFDQKNVYCFYVEHCIFNAYGFASSSLGSSTGRKFSLNPSQNSAVRKPGTVSVHCPKHGVINLNSIAPDIVFNDIHASLKIKNEQLDRCKLIGRGTFGFVFKGTLRNLLPLTHLNHLEPEVALKLLQPVDPGSEADQSDIAAYKSAKSNWIREPFHCACKSYCTARHEVNILQALRHPNIVEFIGLCVKPLAVVLELAPMGCLTEVFNSYKKAGSRIDLYSVQKTILQIAKALEFLHQQRVIYRDLKAENVLVWSYPSPYATQPHSAAVELKLTDYGISRQALSTGIWKGFAGTINFLAPEILRYNGDEEYTEKVDCFSFGIFMYELVTLRPPHNPNEGTRNHLTDGGRPTLSLRDLIYPNHIMDLMSVCWSQEPHLRPTASQIVSIASAPEFMQLLNVVDLSTDRVTFCGAVQYLENGECNLDLWLGRSSQDIEVLSASQSHWNEYIQLIPSSSKGSTKKSSMCIIDNKIWLCDTDMTISIIPIGSRLSNHHTEFRLTPLDVKNHEETLNRAQTFPLNIDRQDGNLNNTVKDMIFVKQAHCVIILTSDGQLWIAQLDGSTCTRLDDNMIKYECIAVKEQTPSEDETQSDRRSFILYCGQSGGISCLEIIEDAINRHSILPLASKQFDLSGELIIEPSQSTTVTTIVSSMNLLWTSAGCTVHLWNIAEKRVARKLDCWKLVPCSESLESINIEHYYEQAQSSVVSSMVYLDNQLFVGTSHGCFVVIEADTLKPVIVFRPYESDITILSPAVIRDQSEDSNIKHLVTIGVGYRDLMKRYVNTLDNSSISNNYVAILWSANYYNL